MEGSVYLKARQEWDERYADLVLGKRNWQIAAGCSLVISLMLEAASGRQSLSRVFAPDFRLNPRLHRQSRAEVRTRAPDLVQTADFSDVR